MATDSNQRHTRLQKLGGSDYEIADGQPDIRGWEVKDDSGKHIGDVDELIFDEQSRKVRYIVLDLDGNELNLDDREVLVPIGIAQLDKDDDDVLLPGVTADQLKALPEYNEDRFDTEHEISTRNVFGGLGGAALAGVSNDFYNHEHFNEENLYRNRQKDKDNDSTTIPVIKEELQVGKRQVETGGVRLRSRVVEEAVSQDINLRNETVNVERTAVDRLATDDDLNRTEKEIEMRERAEVPVVNKEARVVEEISLNKAATERTETINDTVRNTEVNIDKEEGDTRHSSDRSND